MRRGITGRRRALLIIGTLVGVGLILSFTFSSRWNAGTTRPNWRRQFGDSDPDPMLFVRDNSMREHVEPSEGEEAGLVAIDEGVVALGGRIQKTKGDKAKCAATFDHTCTDPRLHIRIGAESESSPPFACLNDLSVFSESSLQRGIVAARLDGITQEIREVGGDLKMKEEKVIEVATFDVSTTDGKLIHWLDSLDKDSVVIVASFGDVAERISPDARRALERVGSSRVNEWRGGHAYAILGQRALEKGLAPEVISPLGHSDVKGEKFALSVIEDCFEFPLGKLNETFENAGFVNRLDESRLAELLEEGKGKREQNVELGDEWLRCGMTNDCAEDEISMYLYSGANKDNLPKMCVGGRMVFEDGLNHAGRGLNVAVVDAKSKRIVKTGHFDTYEEESTELELFLDGLTNGDIVAVVSFDEASNKLSDMARQIFYELGSSMVNRLKFRASWYFVGQKGIRVFSPFEDLNFASGNSWATAIDKSICVPTSLSGQEMKGTAKGKKMKQINAAKRHFCAKYDRLDEFCEDSHVDDLIVPRPLKDEKRNNDPIFNVPILVVAGMNMNRLRVTLEGLIGQEGINTQMVIVAHNREYKNAGDLALLFHFKPLPINSSSSYNDLLLSSLSFAFSVFPKASSIIVLEEEVIPSPDLLFFFSQLLPVFNNDSTLDIIHAFNYNGFTRTSNSSSTVYRVEGQSPSFSYLIKRSLYETHIASANKTLCCSQLHWWKFTQSDMKSTNGSSHVSFPIGLVPDVSRVQVSEPQQPWLQSIPMENEFREKRTTNKDRWTVLSAVSSLSQGEYLSSISITTNSSLFVNGDKLSLCEGGYEKSWKVIMDAPERHGRSVTIEYSKEDNLHRIVSCLGLFKKKLFIAGEYRGIVRFHLHGIPVVLQPKR